MSKTILHSAVRPGGIHSCHRPRGLTKTPRHRLAGATPFRPLRAPSDGFAVVPSQLSMWDNDRDGDCVTAEEAFAKACWSLMCGLPELFIPDAEVIRWASKYGFLNGAMLPDVMDQMAKDGFTVGGVNYKDGPYQAVDYSNEPMLQSSIETGPVKIGIDANALSPDAGNGSGWFSIGGTPGSFNNEDHCVGLCGHGTAAFLFGKLGLPVPASIDPAKRGYLLFTWSSIGFVDHDWLMSTEAEAWVRNPTTVGQSPVPGPTPTPTPTPPGPTPIPPAPIQTLISNGVVSIPGQSVAVPGLFGHTISIPGQSVSVSVVGQLPSSGLTTDAIAGYLTAAGITADSTKLTPAQWQAILAMLLQLLPIFFPPAPSGSVGDRIGKLTPQQWQAILALVMQLLPLIIGG